MGTAGEAVDDRVRGNAGPLKPQVPVSAKVSAQRVTNVISNCGSAVPGSRSQRRVAPYSGVSESRNGSAGGSSRPFSAISAV